VIRRALLLVALASSCASCALVPQNRRAHFADTIMQFDEGDATEAHRKQKFYSTREGAAGGDGVAAGGGCGCQ
jgi:hypothetical protein